MSVAATMALALLMVVAVGCDRGEFCEDVPSMDGLTASVDLDGAPGYLDRAALLAATDEALAAFDLRRVGADADVTIRWGQPEDARWLAVTLDGRAIVLSPAWSWSVDACEDRVGHDVTTVLEHELGHVAGLQHTTTGLMRPWIATCEVTAVCMETGTDERSH